jgi:glycosyltransferase involved in cell wall biosynthesis
VLAPLDSVLFWDPSCIAPYDTRAVQCTAIGGSESSLSRIADALGACVIQHNRTQDSGNYRVPAKIAGITHVVLSRDARALPRVRELYPDARYILWVHDLIQPGSKRGRRLARMAALLSELAVTIVCVSDSQRRGVEATLQRMGVADRVRTITIYNPIDDALTPDGSPVDRDKLVFFSSPNKGLKFTLDAFRAMRRQMPELRLLVGNPGYKTDQSARIEGVTWLGPQPQARIHAEVRTALCTFCPNFVIPETFGLVFAESMALGTPVLTHDCGAASEIIGDPAQVLPVTRWHRAYERALGGMSSRFRSGPARMAAKLGLFDPYIERIRAWRAGARPHTGPDPRFALATVAGHWRALLASS